MVGEERRFQLPNSHPGEAAPGGKERLIDRIDQDSHSHLVRRALFLVYSAWIRRLSFLLEGRFAGNFFPKFPDYLANRRKLVRMNARSSQGTWRRSRGPVVHRILGVLSRLRTRLRSQTLRHTRSARSSGGLI